MEIVGKVISVQENTATVSVKRVSACGENCANCKGACEATTAVSTAYNTVGAAVGDMVKIESESSAVIRAAVVLYIFPVVAAILAGILTYGAGNILAVVTSAAVFFACFLVIKLFEKKLTPKSYITKILDRDVK